MLKSQTTGIMRNSTRYHSIENDDLYPEQFRNSWWDFCFGKNKSKNIHGNTSEDSMLQRIQKDEKNTSIFCWK